MTTKVIKRIISLSKIEPEEEVEENPKIITALLEDKETGETSIESLTAEEYNKIMENQ